MLLPPMTQVPRPPGPAAQDTGQAAGVSSRPSRLGRCPNSQPIDRGPPGDEWRTPAARTAPTLATAVPSWGLPPLLARSPQLRPADRPCGAAAAALLFPGSGTASATHDGGTPGYNPGFDSDHVPAWLSWISRRSGPFMAPAAGSTRHGCRVQPGPLGAGPEHLRRWLLGRRLPEVTIGPGDAGPAGKAWDRGRG